MAAKVNYDKTALKQPLSELLPGSPVRVHASGKWSDQVYKVIDKASTPRSYMILNDKSCRKFRRNRRQLLPAISDTPDESVTPNTTAHTTDKAHTNTVLDTQNGTNFDSRPIPKYTTNSGRVVKAPKRFSPD